MTTDVVTVDQITPFKEIARLLVEYYISAVSVLSLGRHVSGVVSEADLIAARDRHAAERKRWTRMLRYGTDHSRYLRLTAQLKSPALTTHPDATIASAASLMTTHHVKRLLVVDPDGKLVCMVSRRDLLSAFLISDAEIAGQVREVLAEALPDEPEAIKVAVHSGIVTLTGHPEDVVEHSQIAAAIDLFWNLDGVVDLPTT